MQFEFPISDPRCDPKDPAPEPIPPYELTQLSLPSPIGIKFDDIARSPQQIERPLSTEFEGVFFTALGSRYETLKGSATVRTQFRHIQVFSTPVVHEPSMLTVYVRPSGVALARFEIEFAQLFSKQMGLQHEHQGEALYSLKDGSLGWIAWPQPQLPLVTPICSFIHYECSPRIGLAPLELWWNVDSGKLNWHEGHTIKKIGEK